MLEVSELVKAFGNLRAVDGVSFTVDAGTITGLIGPNGAGKTTLFNLIAGALVPEAGAIRYRGERIDGLTPDRIFTRGLARTFQVPRPFPQMTVLENLMAIPFLALDGPIGRFVWMLINLVCLVAMSIPVHVERQGIRVRDRFHGSAGHRGHAWLAGGNAEPVCEKCE